MSIFALIRISMLVSLFFYTQWKVTQIFLLKFPAAFAVTFLLYVVMIGWIFISRIAHISMESPVSKVIIWMGGLTMALWATFMVFHLIMDVAMFVTSFFVKESFTPERRDFFIKSFSIGILGASILMVGAGVAQALQGAVIKKVKIISDKITKNLKGLKIAQISDLHVGLTIDKSYIEDVVAKTMELNADIIVITGDIADGTPDSLAERLTPLANLKAPLGVFYIVGNHEYYWGVDKWVQAAKNFGFVTLLNENKILKYNGDSFLIGGVTDTAPDAMKAVQSSEKVLYKILLAHKPENYDQAEKAGFDLQLSGHTHAGQFFPFSLLIPLFHRYYRGLNKHNDMYVYVNQGTGYWGPADRFAVPSEITLLELG